QGLGLSAYLDALEFGKMGGPPFREQGHDASVEGREFGMPENGGLDLADGEFELEIVRAVGFFQNGGADAGKNLPEAIEGLDIAPGDAAAQMGFDVLYVFGFGAVDIAGQVEVEIIGFDFGQGHHARVAG